MYGIGPKEGVQEPLPHYHGGTEDSLPVLNLVNNARERISLVKHSLIGAKDAQNELDKVMDIVSSLARENEVLKNKMIRMYEKWGSIVTLPSNNTHG